jgi:hypothetical protein
MRMMLLAFAAALPCATPAVAQTSLQKPACNAAIIETTEQKIAAMKDGPQKRTATLEIAAAKATLAKKATAECQNHLLKATLQTK